MQVDITLMVKNPIFSAHAQTYGVFTLLLNTYSGVLPLFLLKDLRFIRSAASANQRQCTVLNIFADWFLPEVGW